MTRKLKKFDFSISRDYVVRAINLTAAKVAMRKKAKAMYPSSRVKYHRIK